MMRFNRFIKDFKKRRKNRREKVHRFFAWRPVFAEDEKKWIWLENVSRVSFKMTNFDFTWFENVYFVGIPNENYFCGWSRYHETEAG